MFIEFSSLVCPAEQYVLSIWGHGTGFSPMTDVPGKYEVGARQATRGVIGDEWNDKEQLNMYELRDAIKATGIDRLNTLFFHNCMMGNLETLTTVNDYAHLLAQETGDTEMQTISTELDNAFKAAFIHYRDINWSQQHLDHYTLSVCLVHQLYYTYDYKDILPNPLCRFDEGYEYCDFHRMTGWGDWLRMNQQRLVSNPQSGGGGPSSPWPIMSRCSSWCRP